MGKHSCISPPPQDRFVTLSRWHIEICEGNKCAALILSVMISYHDFLLTRAKHNTTLNEVAEIHGDQATQDVSLLQFHTHEELSDRILGLYGTTTISKALQQLKNLGLVSTYNNPNPRYSYDRTVHYLLHPEVIEAWFANRSPTAPAYKNCDADVSDLEEKLNKSAPDTPHLKDRVIKNDAIHSPHLVFPNVKGEGTIQNTDRITERNTTARLPKTEFRSKQVAAEVKNKRGEAVSALIGESLTPSQHDYLKQRLIKLPLPSGISSAQPFLEAVTHTLLDPESYTQAGKDFHKKLNTVLKQIRLGQYTPPAKLIDQHGRARQQQQHSLQVELQQLANECEHWEWQYQSAQAKGDTAKAQDLLKLLKSTQKKQQTLTAAFVQSQGEKTHV